MTEDKNTWRYFFDHHAPIYNDNCFTKATEQEIPFLIELLGLPKGSTLLDVGCGTGRHSVGLAKYGYKVTGYDLSPGMLAQAKKTAESIGAEVEWVEGDATKLPFENRFDAAIGLCEGALGLIGKGEDPLEHDLSVVRGILRALKPGGRAVLNCLNAIKKYRQFKPEDIAAGKFNPMTCVESIAMEFDDDTGKGVFNSNEKGYVPGEFRLLLIHAGFEIEHLWGGTAGNWGKRPVEMDEYELMAVVRKKG